MPAQTLNDLWRAALTHAPRAELAVEVGLQIPLGAFGSMDYLAASSETVADAFQLLVQHLPRIAPGYCIEIEHSAERYRIAFLCRPTPDARELGDDLTLAIVVHHFRNNAEEFPITGIELTRPEPEHPEQFTKLLGARTTFGHVAAAIELEPRAAQALLKTRDPHLLRTLQSLQSRLSPEVEAQPLERKIRDQLRAILPSGRAEAVELARSLGMSERTFHRRLSATGRSYQEIVDSYRRGEAERRLLQADSQLSELALGLGFADQSAFSRAFKRWTGVSPKQWRQRNASG